MIALFSGCEQAAPEPSLAPCEENSGLTVVGEFEHASGEVRKVKLNTREDRYAIFTDQRVEGYSLPLDASNLPQEYKVEGLKIRFSGKLKITHDWDISDYAAQPFELTSLEKL